MQRYQDLIKECRQHVAELMPWDLAELLKEHKPLLLDVREPSEFERIRIRDSINVPRGILEQACEFDFDETVPELVKARDREVIVICRSGNRSLLAARTLQVMGYQRVWSLATGLRGWNEFEQPMIDGNNQVVDLDAADEFFAPKVRPEQKSPAK